MEDFLDKETINIFQLLYNYASEFVKTKSEVNFICLELLIPTASFGPLNREQCRLRGAE